jgi:hypothetical protein
MFAMRMDNLLSIHDVYRYLLAFTSFLFLLSPSSLLLFLCFFFFSSFFFSHLTLLLSCSLILLFSYSLALFLLFGELQEDQKQDEYENCQRQVSYIQLTLKVDDEKVKVKEDLLE